MAVLWSRRRTALFALGAVLAAIAGYLIGELAHPSNSSSHAAVPAAGAPATIAGGVLLELPAGWQAAADPPLLPGLTLTHAAAFAPGGDGAVAGLLTGASAAGAPSPLPRGLVSELVGVPPTEVITLAQTEAFRYAAVHLAGRAGLLTIYALPNPGSGPTSLLCYAPAGGAALMRTCEQIVATLRPVGAAQPVQLAPAASYGSAVGAALATLERERRALRAQMGSSASLARVAGLSTRVAASFATASTTIAAQEPPTIAGPAQAALARALMRARDAYRALAAAASSDASGSYEAARSQVVGAEAAVGAALTDFALLGYRQ